MRIPVYGPLWWGDYLKCSTVFDPKDDLDIDDGARMLRERMNREAWI